MIQAMIFDLDGTLVKTEKLKALSYARAAVELCPYDIQEEQVIEAFKEVVGLSRREVASALVERFGLSQKALDRKDEFGVTTAWQAYVQVRLKYYQRILEDPRTIRDNQWPHTMDLLAQARKANCRLALATMSRCRQARRVLEILGLEEAFDFIATRDDVEKGKPDPEIYHLVAKELGVAPECCLVVEDSVTGVQAALEAGMQVVAVSTPFTGKHLRESGLLPEEHIVDDPGETARVVAHVLQHLE
ncbi:MAG: HAD family phosphatase [Anaerolineales bacterium]|nr:HAD family phosphatase [Anaerolineales bacterium]